MSNLLILGECAICHINGALSKEHIPPKGAFNKDTVLRKNIDKTITSGQIRWKNEQVQGGNHRFSICPKCNNDTGSWYGAEYVNFVKQCAPYASPKHGDKTIDLTFSDIKPLQIVKEALVIMCSACGPEFSSNLIWIRKMIGDKQHKQRPVNLRIWLYLRAQLGGRSSGVAGILRTDTKDSRVVSEFSWWPVGWVLSFDDKTIKGLLEVTEWCSYYNYDEQRTLRVAIPCRWTETAYPLDYRDPKVVEKEREAQALAR